MEEEKVIIAQGSLDFNDQTIGYSVSKISNQILISISFIKSGEKKETVFIFDNTNSNNYELNDTSAIVGFNINIDSFSHPTFTIYNIPSFGEVTLGFNESNDVILTKGNRELLNLTESSFIDKNQNIKVDRIIEYFSNGKDHKNQIISKTMEDLKNSFFIKINNSKAKPKSILRLPPKGQYS